MCIGSELGEHCLQLVVGIGQKRKVVCKQQLWHSEIRDALACALHPLSHIVDIVQVDRKKQRGEVAALLHTKLWLYTCLLVPVQQCVFICAIQVLKDGE